MIIIIASMILLTNPYDAVDEDAIFLCFLFLNTPKFIFFGWTTEEIELRK